FLGIVLRDPKTSLLSTSPIQEKLSKNGLKIHPELEEFIKTHPEVNTLDSLDAHRAWVPLVQGLKDIHYVNGDYEMDTTLNNLFHVMDHLLFQKSILTDPSLKNSKKMDRLCEFLSRDEFEL